MLPLKSDASATVHRAASSSGRGAGSLTPDEDYPMLSASPASLQTVSTDLQRLSNYVELLASSSTVSDLDLQAIPPPEKFRNGDVGVSETNFCVDGGEVMGITVRHPNAPLPSRPSQPLKTFQVDSEEL